MSEELANSIVKAAKMMEMESSPKRRYFASLLFYPKGDIHWVVETKKNPSTQFRGLVGALNYLADANFYVSQKQAEQWLAEANALSKASGNANVSIEFLVSRESQEPPSPKKPLGMRIV